MLVSDNPIFTRQHHFIKETRALHTKSIYFQLEMLQKQTLDICLTKDVNDEEEGFRRHPHL